MGVAGALLPRRTPVHGFGAEGEKRSLARACSSATAWCSARCSRANRGLPPWRELAAVYRRLEARGEIRGGRFVSGFGGEQFALPDAVGRLRAVRKQEKSGELVALSGADPLNLVGILTPDARVPAIAKNRVLFHDGLAIAALEGGEVRRLAAFGPGRRDAAGLARAPRERPGGPVSSARLRAAERGRDSEETDLRRVQFDRNSSGIVQEPALTGTMNRTRMNPAYRRGRQETMTGENREECGRRRPRVVLAARSDGGSAGARCGAGVSVQAGPHVRGLSAWRRRGHGGAARIHGVERALERAGDRREPAWRDRLGCDRGGGEVAEGRVHGHAVPDRVPRDHARAQQAALRSHPGFRLHRDDRHTAERLRGAPVVPGEER